MYFRINNYFIYLQMGQVFFVQVGNFPYTDSSLEF